MEKFQFKTYSYVAFLSRSYTITGKPDVLFVKVPSEKEMTGSQAMFLDNIPNGLKVFVETPGNVESVFLVSANILKGTDSAAIQDDVDLVYRQFGNVKQTLTSKMADVCHNYISSIWLEQFYGLELNKTIDSDEYDYVFYSVGNMPFPALAYVSKENFKLIDCAKLKDLESNGLSLKVGQVDKDGSAKTLNIFFVNHKTVDKSYVTELKFICHHIQQFKYGNTPELNNVELLNKFIGSL